MEDKDLREKVARKIVEILLDDDFEVVELSGAMACEIADLLASPIIALIKEDDYKSPEEIKEDKMEDKELEQTILQRIRLFCDEDCWVDEVTLTEGFICPVMDCGKCFAKFGVLALIKETGYVKLAEDQTAECTLLHENSLKDMITQDYLNGRESLISQGFRKVEGLK